MNLHPILKIDKSFMRCYLKKSVILMIKQFTETQRKVCYAFVDTLVGFDAGWNRLP